MKNYTLQMTAGQAYPLAAPGNFVRVSGGTGPVHVAGSKREFEFTAPVGLGFELPRFDGLEFTSETDQALTVYVGLGKVDDSRLVLAGGLAVDVSGTTTLETGQATATAAGGLLVAADAGRRSLLIESEGEIFIGPAGVTVANGYKVNGAISLDTGAAVHAIVSGADVACQYIAEVN